jgi:hypothetical protein
VLIPEVDVVGKHQVDVLVVLAGEHGIEAADLPGNRAMPLFSAAGPFRVGIESGGSRKSPPVPAPRSCHRRR